MEQKLTPVADKVIVREFQPEDVTRGGLVLPSQAQEEPNRGVAIAVGPRCHTVKVGDICVYTPYTGRETRLGAHGYEGDQLVFLREEEITAALEKGDDDE